jgi:uncharacterized protein (TIGR02996 family)
MIKPGPRAALLAAIRRDPADETLRLAFADLIQEEGDEKWAQFIRAQIELKYTRKNTKAGKAKQQQVYAMFVSGATKETVSPAVSKNSFVGYHDEMCVRHYHPNSKTVDIYYLDGLPCKVVCTKRLFVNQAASFFEWPITSVRLYDAEARYSTHSVTGGASFDWWPLHAESSGREYDYIPQSLFKVLSRLNPKRCCMTDSARFGPLEFASEVGATRALNAAALVFGRESYAKAVAKKARRRIAKTP